MNKVLSGKEVAASIYEKLQGKVNGLKVVIITIGDDDASKVYVRNKMKACEKVGFVAENIRFNPIDFKYKSELAVAVKSTIASLNSDEDVVGIIVQKPYPEYLKMYGIEYSINPIKDVDGLAPNNMSQTLLGRRLYHYPATPQGIMIMLKYYNIPVAGKNVVVIGRSEIVGRPMATMLDAANATVTVCHSKTSNLREYTRMADIIIVAVGKPKFIDSTYITDEYHNIKGELCKKSIKFPTIIDVGMNRDENRKLCGDVDFDDVLPYVSNITTVPGGVGVVTVASFVLNCYNAFMDSFKSGL